MQALQNATIDSLNLTFLSLIPVHLGTLTPLYSFFLDPGLFRESRAVAVNCTALREDVRALAQLFGVSPETLEAADPAAGAPAPAAAGGSARRLAQDESALPGSLFGADDLNQTLSRCINGSITSAASTEALDARLYCANVDNVGPDVKVRSDVCRA